MQSQAVKGVMQSQAAKGGTRRILPFQAARRKFETAYVERLLRRTGNDVAEAARLADKDRSDFYVLMKRCGIDIIARRRVRSTA